MNATIIAVAFAVMSLGLNVVVGFAGLLDLGYVAFYALGAYSLGWFGSDFFFKAHVHVGVTGVAATETGIHLNFLLILICRRADLRAGRDAHRPAHPAPARRLHRDRHARLRRDHRRGRRQRPERQPGRRHDPDRRQPGDQRRRRAVLPRHRRVQPAQPETLVLADLRDPAARPVRQPAAARLAPRAGLGGAARGRGGGRVDGHPAGAHQALGLRDRRHVRRHVGRLPGHLLHRGQRRPVPVRLLDLRPRHGHHRRAGLDLGGGGRAACCSATSTSS